MKLTCENPLVRHPQWGRIHRRLRRQGLSLTSNRHKISITLEELGLQYNVHKLEFSKNQQKEPWFLEINRKLYILDPKALGLLHPVTNDNLSTANGRIPALVDNTSGKPKRVFEGASMQLYLCEKYDKDHKISFPYDSDEYWETVEWLVWMVSLQSH
jgi:glutathione S-transferase